MALALLGHQHSFDFSSESSNNPMQITDHDALSPARSNGRQLSRGTDRTEGQVMDGPLSDAVKSAKVLLVVR